MKHAMRYYNLQDNPCRKAGAIGKSKGEPKDFWMQEEFNAFLETVSDKPETRIAFIFNGEKAEDRVKSFMERLLIMMRQKRIEFFKKLLGLAKI